MNPTLESSFIGRPNRFRFHLWFRRLEARGRRLVASSRTGTCRNVRLGSTDRRRGFRGCGASRRVLWGSLRLAQGPAEERQDEGEGEKSEWASHDVGHTPLGLLGPNFGTIFRSAWPRARSSGSTRPV